MKCIRLFFIAVLLAITVFLNACHSKTPVSECIGPPVTWEFPVMATMPANFLLDSVTEIPPPGSWEVVTTLPESGYVYDLAAHSRDHIWIILNHDLYGYSTRTRRWKKFSSTSKLEVGPNSLYVANDGTLWGIDFSGDGSWRDYDFNVPLLMRYDETADRFEFVEDRDRILHSGMSVVGISEPVSNPSGELWLLLIERVDEEYIHRLVSFNPENLTVTQHLTSTASIYTNDLQESRFNAMGITDDGRVWIADYGKGQLLYYDPSSGEFHSYQGHPGALNGFSTEDLRDLYFLYVDRMGHLWVDDRGWFDFSDPRNMVWHKVVRSPAFITDFASPENQYGWSRPDQMYHSSNGLYWFSVSGAGMVVLDPTIGEWCKFTTESSPISEDSQGYLWIAVYGKLYRYPLAR